MNNQLHHDTSEPLHEITRLRDPTRLRIAKRIRISRKARNLTQAQLALHLGIPRTAVTMIEAGDRAVTAEELYQICLMLQVDPGTIIELRLFD